MNRSVCVRVDQLVTIAGYQGKPDIPIGRGADRADRSVAEDEVGLAGMERAGKDHAKQRVVADEVRGRSHVEFAARIAANIPALRIPLLTDLDRIRHPVPDVLAADAGGGPLGTDG